MAVRFLLCIACAGAILRPGVAQAPADCGRNPDQARWFVRAGAPADGTGANARPFASLADIERCAPAGATITVLAPGEGAAPLDGGIRLKDRQKLLGAAPPKGGKPVARLTNTGGTGDAVFLAHGNEVANLHIDNPAGTAVFGWTRRCARSSTAEAVDMSQSVLRGCNSGPTPIGKAAIVLLADDAAAVATVKYSILRVAIQDIRFTNLASISSEPGWTDSLRLARPRARRTGLSISTPAAWCGCSSRCRRRGRNRDAGRPRRMWSAFRCRRCSRWDRD